MRGFIRKLGLAATAAFLAYSAPAFASSGGCSSQSVLSFIDSRFDYKAQHYLHRDLDISRLDRVRTVRIGLRDPVHSVERIYCRARATFNDGHRRNVWYLIERNWGFAGIGQSVEFCVSGLDPWNAYGRQCRSVR